MKLCNGCKHFSVLEFCDAAAQPPAWVINPATGRGRFVVRGHDGSIFRQPAESMRQQGRPCGQERALWEPGILARLFPWAFD